MDEMERLRQKRLEQELEQGRLEQKRLKQAMDEERDDQFLGCIGWLFLLGLLGGIAFVVWHFITKYW